MDIKRKQILNSVMRGGIPSAQVNELVDAYYQCVTNSIGTDAVDYPEELLRPLAEREGGILDALNVLAESGCRVDESDGCFNALMLAVGWADEPMVAWLLSHGADPHTWPCMEELPEVIRQNYYLENIDIHYMYAGYDRDEVYQEALRSTAMTLVKMSGLKNFGGLCLRVNETGEVDLHPAKKKY